ncbi:MAG: GHKL domain-containing protein [Leptolyngbyaceae cyanobacterium MAG.088]|nr:GHKL domain-containing protein [Leptolyngbyaceae cyanobacterium MAG.088]
MTEVPPKEKELTEQLKSLDKENRKLKKTLARQERNLERLHQSRQMSESLLSRAVQEAQQSEQALQLRSQELEKALNDVRAIQSRLLTADKMSALGVLVAGVAHEINNPVSFIYGNLEYAQQYMEDLLTLVSVYQTCYPKPNPEVKDCMDGIELEFLKDDLPKVMSSMRMGAKRIKEIVLSLRTFSRTDEAEYKQIDLHTGLESTLVILGHRLKASADNAEIQVTKSYGELPQVACYAGQINQVFMNILSNAIDALKEAKIEEPKIDIATHCDNHRATITIADNGPGIPANIQEKIFDPFFSTKPVGKGTGLGMALSYQIIVEKHHGQLLYDAAGPGATFIIHLPLK